jgi:dTMP kinase
MKQLQQGMLVAIEGIDGSGKSTLAHHVYHTLKEQSLPALLTHEPGDSTLGTHIRTILHNPAIEKTPKAEFLLFAADRAQHFDSVVLPALAKKYIVISDRMADSSVVYQGYARGLDTLFIKQVNAWAMRDREPDIVIYVRVSAELALQRRITRNIPLTSFEQESKDFFKKVAHGFDQLMSTKANAHILDGTKTIEELTKIAAEIILRWIQNNATIL